MVVELAPLALISPLFHIREGIAISGGLHDMKICSSDRSWKSWLSSKCRIARCGIIISHSKFYKISPKL